jgi:hypothetical protein
MNEQQFDSDLCADDLLQAREGRSPVPGGATMDLRGRVSIYGNSPGILRRWSLARMTIYGGGI